KEQLDLFVFDIEELEGKLLTLQSTLKKKQSEKQLYQRKEKKFNEAIEIKKDEKLALEKNLNISLRELASIKSRADLLIDMQREMQGFFYGTKRVLQAAKRSELSGICGAIVHLIDIPNMYSDAFEAILGNNA